MELVARKALWLRLRHYNFADLVPPHLWNRVTEAFGGVDASTKAFAGKIARKHGWNTRFALRAIDEYRKFVFLGVSADVVVTPSKVIDVVWHEHLLFTRAYREFCRDVLERDFDHNPELIASSPQTELYAQQFAATLDRYVREFRTTPPADIWGTPKFANVPVPPRKDESAAPASAADVPLYAAFDGRNGSASFFDMPEFSAEGSGGAFSGGGGGSDWGNGDGGSTADGGSTDAGSDGGGSSCSSGCGGGGD